MLSEVYNCLGLGVAFNTVTNFHSISVATPAGATGPVVSILADNLRTSIAWRYAGYFNLSPLRL